jgi:hypothetical protein
VRLRREYKIDKTREVEIPNGMKNCSRLGALKPFMCRFNIQSKGIK